MTEDEVSFRNYSEHLGFYLVSDRKRAFASGHLRRFLLAGQTPGNLCMESGVSGFRPFFFCLFFMVRFVVMDI